MRIALPKSFGDAIFLSGSKSTRDALNFSACLEVFIFSLHYLCRHDGKVCGCYIALAPAWLFHLFASRRNGGRCPYRLPGRSIFRTEEVLYGDCAEYTSGRSYRLRGKGSDGGIGFRAHSPSPSVSVLGVVGGLLSLYAGRCL